MIATLTVPGVGFEIPLNVVITGVIAGLTYSLIAIGLTLIYRTTRVLNFAAGEMGALTRGLDPDPRDQPWLALLAGPSAHAHRRGLDRRAHRAARDAAAVPRAATHDAGGHHRSGPGAVRVQPPHPSLRRSHREGVPDPVPVAPHRRQPGAEPRSDPDPHRGAGLHVGRGPVPAPQPARSGQPGLGREPGGSPAGGRGHRPRVPEHLDHRRPAGRGRRHPDRRYPTAHPVHRARSDDPAPGPRRRHAGRAGQHLGVVRGWHRHRRRRSPHRLELPGRRRAGAGAGDGDPRQHAVHAEPRPPARSPAGVRLDAHQHRPAARRRPRSRRVRARREGGRAHGRPAGGGIGPARRQAVPRGHAVDDRDHRLDRALARGAHRVRRQRLPRPVRVRRGGRRPQRAPLPARLPPPGRGRGGDGRRRWHRRRDRSAGLAPARPVPVGGHAWLRARRPAAGSSSRAGWSMCHRAPGARCS